MAIVVGGTCPLFSKNRRLALTKSTTWHLFQKIAQKRCQSAKSALKVALLPQNFLKTLPKCHIWHFCGPRKILKIGWKVPKVPPRVPFFKKSVISPDKDHPVAPFSSNWYLALPKSQKCHRVALLGQNFLKRCQSAHRGTFLPSLWCQKCHKSVEKVP